MEKAIDLVLLGEKKLDGKALLQAEEILVSQCVGPNRDKMCEYWLARDYLAQYSYWIKAGDEARAVDVLAKAEARGREAASRRPNDSQVHILLGKIYQLKLSRNPVSGITQAMIAESPVLTEYRRALELDPDSGEAELGLGIYYQFIPRVLGGDGHRARNHFKRAARLMPENPEPLVWLSISYREENRLVDARKFLNKALALAPDDLFVQSEKARLEAAERAAK